MLPPVGKCDDCWAQMARTVGMAVASGDCVVGKFGLLRDGEEEGHKETWDQAVFDDGPCSLGMAWLPKIETQFYQL